MTGKSFFHFLNKETRNDKCQLSIFLASVAFALFFCTSVQAADTVTYYDFIEHAREAIWYSGAREFLTFPGREDDPRGFALYRSNIELEDNRTYGFVLETHPSWESYGFIQGMYPEITVGEETELAIKVGFIKGASATDGARFMVFFRDGSGDHLMAQVEAAYDGRLNYLVIPLHAYYGRTGRFILFVNALSSSTQDWAVWARAEIRPFGNPVVILTECPLPPATVGEFYSYQLEAGGGEVPPYVWTLMDGDLPLGLELNETTGVISGTPTATGTYAFRIGACDSTQLDAPRCSEPKDCYIQVTESGQSPPTPDPFNYNLRVNPSTLTLPLDPLVFGAYEVTTVANVSVSLESGIGQTVHLSISGLPMYTSYYCEPGNGLAPFDSDCTIVARRPYLPAAGDYPITVQASGGGINRAKSVTLRITRGSGTVGDLEIVSVEPVQVLYGTRLVHGKNTAFKLKVNSTFSVPMDTRFKLELPDEFWEKSLLPGDLLPPDWSFPEIWGPVQIPANARNFEVMLPYIPDSDRNEAFYAYPAGIMWSNYGPDLRNAPRPVPVIPSHSIEGTVHYAVEIDPRGEILEVNEDNNRREGSHKVLPTRRWNFLVVPYVSYKPNSCAFPYDMALQAAKRNFEYVLATFPIADLKFDYHILSLYEVPCMLVTPPSPYSSYYVACEPGISGCTSTCSYHTRWEEEEGRRHYESRHTFLGRIARLAKEYGFDFGVGLGCWGGGASGTLDAVYIGAYNMEEALLAHEFNHVMADMGDIYSSDCYCNWGEPYCELPNGDRFYCCWDKFDDERQHDEDLGVDPSLGCLVDCGQDEDDCDPACCWNRCDQACQAQGGTVHGCPDMRIDLPTPEGFWVNRWEAMHGRQYFMDGPRGNNWIMLYSSEDSGFSLCPDARGVDRDGYQNLFYYRFYSRTDPEALLVSGTINKNGTVVLDSFSYLKEANLDIEPNGDGEYSFILLDGNGAILSKSGFNVSFYRSDPEGGAVDETTFVYRIEWKEGTKRIELRDKENLLLASRDVSPNKPKVKVLFPNGGETFNQGERINIIWKGTDRDRDRLTYSLAISQDGGKVWLPIDFNLMDHRFGLETSALQEGQTYLIKVRVTDGVNSGEDVSDGFFSINPPSLPDLTGQWISVEHHCKKIGKGMKCEIKGRLEVQNIGHQDAPTSEVKFFLSEDGAYDHGDVLLKRVSTGKIKPGESKVRVLSFNFKTGKILSGKYILAVMDSEHSVVESNEENNVAVYGPIP